MMRLIQTLLALFLLIFCFCKGKKEPELVYRNNTPNHTIEVYRSHEKLNENFEQECQNYLSNQQDSAQIKLSGVPLQYIVAIQNHCDKNYIIDETGDDFYYNIKVEGDSVKKLFSQAFHEIVTKSNYIVDTSEKVFPIQQIVKKNDKIVHYVSKEKGNPNFAEFDNQMKFNNVNLTVLSSILSEKLNTEVRYDGVDTTQYTFTISSKANLLKTLEEEFGLTLKTEEEIKTTYTIRKK